MSTTNQTVRVLELLKRFNNDEIVGIESLQNDPLWYGKSEKTIRRDIDVVKEYFPESFELIRGGKGEKGCYKAVTKKAFENFINPEVLSLMVQTFNLANKSNLFDSFDLSDSDKRILETKIKETNKLYEFKNKPFETKKDDMVIFKALEYAIKYQKYTFIEYPIKGEIQKLQVKPYKIVFINENFYIACEVDIEVLEFAMYRISKIKSIEDTAKQFQMNPEIMSFIKDMQTPFATYKRNYKKYLIDVEIEIDSSKAFYYKVKKHLKSQEILKIKDNGNLIVNYKVTNMMEIEPLIKSWIPYIKVISPKSLKDKIEKDLIKYLKE